MTWRLSEHPQHRALTGTVIGRGRSRREIVWIVSAGELLDELSHQQIWKRGSAAEACMATGDRRHWRNSDA